jgi:NitT/TauT family transport system ATP-binding protein
VPAAEPVLRLQQAGFGHGGVIVIRIDRLDVIRGEVVGFVGRSGCGKTTILSAIAGLHEPIDGEILISGERRSREWRAQHTARTLQSFPLFHWLTVRGNLELACRIRGVPEYGVMETLREFSADCFADQLPRHLSGGERCRASLAQAVVAQPDLLLLDEPFTGLDTVIKEEISATLFRFAQRNGVGVILVTHDIEDAVNYSDRVLVVGGVPTHVVAEIDPHRSDANRAIRVALRENR